MNNLSRGVMANRARRSVIRDARTAAFKNSHDRRLRPIAIEPVVGNQSSRDDDTGPEHEGDDACDSGASRNEPGNVPLGDAAIDPGVEDPYVDTSGNQEDELDAGEKVLIRPDRNRKEEKETADDHDDEPRDAPG